MKKAKLLNLKRTGLYRCRICGGAGTTQIYHCGQLTLFEPAQEKK